MAPKLRSFDPIKAIDSWDVIIIHPKPRLQIETEQQAKAQNNLTLVSGRENKTNATIATLNNALTQHDQVKICTCI